MSKNECIRGESLLFLPVELCFSLLSPRACLPSSDAAGTKYVLARVCPNFEPLLTLCFWGVGEKKSCVC